MGMFDDLVPQQPKRKAAPEAASSGLFDDLIPGDAYDYRAVEAASATTPNLGDMVVDAPAVVAKPDFSNVTDGSALPVSAVSAQSEAPVGLGDYAMRALGLITAPSRAIIDGIVRADVPGAFRRGTTSALASGAHAVSDLVDQTVQRTNPLAILADAGILTGDADALAQIRDPLGAKKLADESLAVNREIGQDNQAAAAAIGGRPQLGDLLDDPAATLEQLTAHIANQGAQSAPTMALALATRNPEIGAALLGGTTGAQTYTDLRGQGVDRADALAAGAGTGAVEIAGEGLGLPFVMGKAGKDSLLKAILAEGLQEAPVSIAQQNITDQATGEQTPFLQQISDAVDAALVGGTIGGTGHVATNTPAMLGDLLAPRGEVQQPAAVAPTAPPTTPEGAAEPVAANGTQERPAPVLDTARIAEALGDLAVSPEAQDDLAALLANAGIAPEQLGALLGSLNEPAPSPANPSHEAPPASAAAQPSPVRPDTPPTREAAEPAAQIQTTGQPVQASAGQSAPVPAGADLADRPRGETVTPSSVAAAVNLGDEMLDPDFTPEGRSPEAPPRRADRDQVLSMRQEIGWSTRGGELVRATADASAMSEDERQGLVAAPKGEVIGRTRWIGQSAPTGGESTFWRDRPTKWTEAQANAAFDAFERGDKLTRQQQKIIDYAQSVADTYAQAEAEQAADLAAFDEVTQQREFVGLRADIDEAIAQGDRAEALSLYQLVTKLVKAGHPIESLDQPENESDRAYAARLWQLTKEAPRGPDTRATREDQAAGNQGRAGGNVAAAEALGDFALDAPAAEPARAQEVSRPAQSGLFAPPTARETVADAQRRRDAERDGRNASRTDMAAGDGELFAGRRPEQGGLESTEELTDADLTEDERAAFARQSGGREAQLRAAVDAALGPVASKVKYLPDHKSLPERLRKGVESRLRQRGGGGQTAALFDPKTGDVYLFTNANPSPGRAVFNVAHEIAGHQGLRALLGDALNPALDLALQNPTVAAVSEAIALERNIDASTDAGQRLAAEEALAELAAAVRTGNYDLIADRYGVDVPQGIRASVARAIENFLRRLKALLAKQGATFSDEDVRELLENAWQAAQGEAAVDGDAADSTAPDQTKTPEFRRWFGDSKVVDADGKPLVVYHGTATPGFDKFKMNPKGGIGGPLGVWFASKPEAVERFATQRYAGQGPGVYPVFLSIENPSVYHNWQDFVAHVNKLRGRRSIEDGMRALRKSAMSRGYDGIVIRNSDTDGGVVRDDWVAFRPEQIKSATANRGTFDPDSPSILESVAEPIPANATGRSIIDSGRLLSVIDAAKAAGLDLSALKDAHAKNSASAFVQAIDDLMVQMRPKPRVTGTKNAITDAEREAAGRHPILRDAVQTNEETIVRAMRELRDDPSAGPEAVQRLAKNGASGISLADEAILLVHKTELLNQRDAAAKKLADPNASEDAKEVARQQWTDLEAQITVLDQAAVNSGREWGRLGQFRQRMLREDFTFEALERKERARLERPLTPDESATIAALAARIADLQSQVDMLQARVGNAESEGAYEALVKQLARPPKSRPTLESLRKAANDARARLQAAPSVPSRNRQSGAIMSPSLFADYAIIGAYHIANGAAKFADWVGAMRADLGDRFDAFKAEHPNIFKAARRQLDKPLKADATVAEVLERIDPANLKPRDVRKLIEALVGEGLRGEQAVIKSAAKHLEIAEDEVRALFVQTAPSAEPTLSEAQEELRDLKKLVRLQAEIDRLEAGEPKPPRGTTREDSPVVAERKAELAEVRKRLKPVRDPEGRYQEMRGKQIEKRIAELQARIAAGDFATRPRVPRTLSEANQRAMFELDKAKEAFLRHQFLESLKARSKWGKALGFVGDSLNLSRAIMTSIDLSALFRQGGFVTFGHPLRAGRAFADTLPALFSENAEHRVMNEIKQRPNADLYRRHGLALTGIGAGTLNKIEEAYAARWLDKVALVEGQIIRNLARRVRNLALAPTRGSGRVYAAFLNQLRADSFDAMAATMTRTGVPTEAEAKWIAGFVNTATGRGKIPGKRDNAGEIVNMLAFAPRLVASRFSLVTGAPIFTAPSGRAMKAAVAEYARFLAGTAVVMSLLAYGLDDDGDDEEFADHFTFDPRSSDFMKLRFGNTRIDPFTGLAQVSTFLAREIAGETVTAAGAVKPLRPKWTLTDLRRAFGEDIPAHKLDKDGKMPYGAKDNFDVIADFARSKMSPAAGASANVLTGSDFLGRPITLAGQAGEMLAPMSFGDIADVMEDQGIPRGTAMAAVGLLGMSLQVRKQTNAEQFADFVAEGKAVQADVKDRLAAMPVEQWPSALAAMKKEYWPMLAGVELDYYKQDGKYGEAGEPKRDADGKPKLESTRISSDYREAAGAKGGEQAHHLITDRLARRHPLMAHARGLGYDLDRPSNLLAMPEEGGDGAISHNTDHPDYDAEVFGALNAAEKRLKRDHGSLKDAPVGEVLDAVRDVEDAMRERIQRRDVPTKDGRLSALDSRPTAAA